MILCYVSVASFAHPYVRNIQLSTESAINDVGRERTNPECRQIFLDKAATQLPITFLSEHLKPPT